MNKNIIKLFAILMVCFALVSVLVACGADGKDGADGKSPYMGDDGKLYVWDADKNDFVGYEIKGEDGEDGEDLTCGDSVHVFAKEGTVILEHSYDAVNDVATPGVVLYPCEVCGVTYAEVTDHEFEDVVTAPTCTAVGYTTHTCACGYSYTDTEVAATGHATAVAFDPNHPSNCEGCDMCAVWTKAPIDASLVEGVNYCPCTHEHTYSAPCTNGCGEDVFETANAAGHTWGEEKASVNLEGKPECQWNRPMFHECTACSCTETADFNCGRVENTRELGAMPHDYTDVEGVILEGDEPTCTEPGTKSFACTYCGEYTKTEEVPALGHEVVNHEALAPTCTGTGWDAYDTCSRCDYTTRGEDIPALGHAFTTESEVVLVAPTADAAGSLKFLCDTCGEVAHTVELPALTDENCGEEGFYTKGHEGTHCGDWVDTYTFTVEVNGEEYTNTLKVENFSDHTEYVEGVTATRTVEGDNYIYTVYKCEKCGLWVVVDTQPKPEA